MKMNLSSFLSFGFVGGVVLLCLCFVASSSMCAADTERPILKERADLRSFVGEVSSRAGSLAGTSDEDIVKKIHRVFVDAFANRDDPVWTKYPGIYERYQVVTAPPASRLDVIVRPKDPTQFALCVFADLHVGNLEQ